MALKASSTGATARSGWTGPSTPALIRGAALCTAAGIALSLTDYGDSGRWITVIGVLLLLLSLHRFGRLGPDEAIQFELGKARKKRKNPKKNSASGAGSPETDIKSEP